MQKTEGTAPVLSGEIAVSLLHGWLEKNELTPTNGLVALFATAGELAANRDPGRRILSSTLLLLAAVELGKVTDGTSADDAALKVTASLLQRHPDRLKTFEASFFEPGRAPSDKAVALSPNVGRMLLEAGPPRIADESPSAVNTASFLLTYPLARGRANHLFEFVGIRVEAYGAAVYEAIQPFVPKDETNSSTQRPYEPADPRKTVAHSVRTALNEFLAKHGRRASEDLEFIFEMAAGLSLSHMQGRPVITTELVLFAIAQRGANALNLPEGKRIVAYAAILHRSEQFRERLSKVPSFHEVEFARYLLPVTFTPNVQRALGMAYDTAVARDPGDDYVTVRDFLRVFPPVDSVAARMLTTMGVDTAELQIAASTPETGDTLETINAASRTAPNRVQPTASNKREGGRARNAPAPTKGATRKARKDMDSDDANDRVAVHTDEPAELDELGRRPFAEVLAERIREAQASGDGGSAKSAFMVHLHGPWGAGKSSVLNFLEQDLSKGPNSWIVVRFNAWRDQRLQPPWWSLISNIYAGASPKLSKKAGWKLWRRWLWWRVKVDFVPLLAAGACLILLAIFIWVGQANSLDKLLTVALGAITLAGALIIGSRSLALGSQRAAQAYADLKNDPYRPIAALFDNLVAAVDRPLAVFIDDLDRCEGKYVVELLEGIQTLMRGAPVTYVVAADRKWICSSFEQRYAAFSPPLGEAGRPLGYLFLDKIFQISAALPQPSLEVHRSYWGQLLSAGKRDLLKEEEARLQAEAEAETQTSVLVRPEQLQALVTGAEKSGDQQKILATRAAAAKRIISEEVSANTEHRLQVFLPLLEPNPRAMKRLVNAYGMHQATMLLAGKKASATALARWTILELRWPLLADFLAYRPEYADRLRKRISRKDEEIVPIPLHGLFGDAFVVRVIGYATAKDRLTSAAIRSILGSVHGDR